MEIEFLSEENKEIWNEFVLKSDTAWFRHTTDWFKYSACCRFDSNTKNHSFMVKQNNEIIAVVPLLSEYLYENPKVNSFSMYGDYTPLPAIKNNCDIDKKKIFDYIQEQILLIAKENNVACAKFSIDPLIKYNYAKDFQFFNYININTQVEFLTTNIIDLTMDENSILQSMRKGHKAAIKQVLKDSDKYRVDIFDSSNITKDILLKFKEIHKIDSGRQTRTDASWDCMYEWIKNGHSILTMLYLNELNDYTAGALIQTYKKSAYYGSYATLDSYGLNGHVGYVIQWESIKYLKNHNFEIYDIGRNEYSKEHLSDEKLLNIVKYKRGFRNREYIVINYHTQYN